jgi:hypothetical protein
MQFLKVTALMTSRTSLTGWLRRRLTVCLCAFVFLPPDVVLQPGVRTVEEERPGQKEGSSEKEQVVSTSAQRCLKGRRYSNLSRLHEIGGKLHQIDSNAGHLPRIVGHQFANGLRAPLLI